MGTIPASENEYPEVLFAEGAAPATPGTGLVKAYAKADGLLYSKDDAGAETALGAAAHIADTGDAHDASAISIADAGTLYTATDVEAALAEVMTAVGAGGISASIVDGKGEIIAGTANDAVDNLAVGANGATLTPASGETTGLKWVPPMYPIAVLPVGCAIAWPGTNSAAPTNATADIARAAPVIVPGAMRVRSMWIHVSSNGAGAVEWGLFSTASTLTAATKVAGGSAAPGGTGWREIAAASAPVSIDRGTYILIVENPAATQSTISTYTTAASMGIFQAKATYTWDDTPDLTSGWSDSTIMWLCYLEGDMDASSTRW